MRIELSTVSFDGTVFEGEEDPETLGLGPSDLCAPAGPIRYRLVARRVLPRLIVAGTVEAPLRAQCRRCGAFFSTTARDSAFLCEYLPSEGQRDVDVTPDIREALLLQIPPHPLCSVACAGVCGRCGRNLNEGPCGCSASPSEASGGAWTALDQWKNENAPGRKPPAGEMS